MFNAILNYHAITNKIASTGQPSKEQLELIAATGYQTVINLALSNRDKALYHQDCFCPQLGVDQLKVT